MLKTYTPTAEQVERARQRAAEYNLMMDDALWQVMQIDAENAADAERS